jgi:hypothetical protein
MATICSAAIGATLGQHSNAPLKSGVHLNPPELLRFFQHG